MTDDAPALSLDKSKKTLPYLSDLFSTVCCSNSSQFPPHTNVSAESASTPAPRSEKGAGWTFQSFTIECLAEQSFVDQQDPFIVMRGQILHVKLCQRESLVSYTVCSRSIV